MNAGRLEQLDRPSTIYSAPRTLFVADFSGQMNILPAVRVGEGLQIGRYSLPAPQELNGSGALNIAVRPEDLVLGPQGSAWGGGKVWDGTIDQAIDLGHYRKMLVILPGLFGDDTDGAAHRVKVYVPKAVEAKEGESVVLFPSRYLVYSGAATPHEVRMQAGTP
jgi:ABC-type Fe3+/spermidine/putrescine transport system ATPase subunit